MIGESYLGKNIYPADTNGSYTKRQKGRLNLIFRRPFCLFDPIEAAR